MAAPTNNTTGATGGTDAGGTWSYTATTWPVGTVVIVQILQDGATAGAVAVTGSSNIVDLAGSAGWTSIGSFAVGSPTAAYQHLFIGRTTSASLTPTISGTNSTSEDLYILARAFDNVSTGTTLATVIENGTAGNTANVVGTSATASDAAVTTLGPDRLALNFVAVDDDNNIIQFSGMTGGTWVAGTPYKEASGTDGALGIMTAEMPVAGTIDGGTGSITDSDNWGVVGFALIGTTPSTRQPRHGFVLFQDPGIV